MSTWNDSCALIIEYWFRVLLSSPSSIADISSIISEFGREIEAFKADQCHPGLDIEAEGAILHKKELDDHTNYVHIATNGFGSFTATRGRAYHWKLKVIKLEDKELNIGIIHADKVSERIDGSYWWSKSGGFSYYARDGHFYSGDPRYSGLTPMHCGDSYGVDDVVDVWLDLRDNAHLSFAKNGKQFARTFDVDPGIEYKLAIGMYGEDKAVQIISFDITH